MAKLTKTIHGFTDSIALLANNRMVGEENVVSMETIFKLYKNNIKIIQDIMDTDPVKLMGILDEEYIKVFNAVKELTGEEPKGKSEYLPLVKLECFILELYSMYFNALKREPKSKNGRRSNVWLVYYKMKQYEWFPHTIHMLDIANYALDFYFDESKKRVFLSEQQLKDFEFYIAQYFVDDRLNTFKAICEAASLSVGSLSYYHNSIIKKGNEPIFDQIDKIKETLFKLKFDTSELEIDKNVVKKRWKKLNNKALKKAKNQLQEYNKNIENTISKPFKTNEFEKIVDLDMKNKIK